MIIFVKDKKDIIKYEILFDKEKLEKLKFEIIEKSSIIEHMDYEDTNFPKMYGLLDYLKYRNYSEIKVGVREYNDFYSMPETLYRFTYDKYHFPYLIELVDKILSGDVKALEDIFNINIKKELVPLDKRIEEVNIKINQTDNDSTYKKIELLKELSDLIKQKELNKNQVNVDKYYLKVRKLFNFKKIDVLSCRELQRVLDFYNISDKIEYTDKKVLRYNKNN